jgi:hypothetical protein
MRCDLVIVFFFRPCPSYLYPFLLSIRISDAHFYVQIALSAIWQISLSDRLKGGEREKEE